jgi:type I restriction enzyme S subunit
LLGEIPAHWEQVPLKRIGRFSRGSGGTKEDEVPDGIPCIRYGDLYSKYGLFITEAKSFVSPERVADYTPVRFGDALFAGSGETLDEIGKSAVNLLGGNVVCGGDVLVFHPNGDITPRFLAYAAACPSSIHQKACMGRGITVMHIYADKLRYLRIALPPIAEQVAIVHVLDHADRRVRRAIRAKQDLIALLNEQKQTLAYAAVTRGLDENVRYRSSGLPWLGDVPEHWQIQRNGQLFVQRNETGFAELPILEVSLRTGVQIRSFETSDRKQVMTDRSKYKRVARGDIAYNMMRMWQGAAGVAPVDGLVSPAYVVARPREGTDSHYFALLFRTSSYMSQIDKYSRGIVKDRNRLYWEDFKQMPSPCPPALEQAQIAQAIEKHAEAIDDATRRSQGEIVLLRAWRARLIADLVTGKLDAREAAGQLPDEVDDVEALDELEAETTDEPEPQDYAEIDA